MSELPVAPFGGGGGGDPLERARALQEEIRRQHEPEMPDPPADEDDEPTA